MALEPHDAARTRRVGVELHHHGHAGRRGIEPNGLRILNQEVLGSSPSGGTKETLEVVMASGVSLCPIANGREPNRTVAPE